MSIFQAQDYFDSEVNTEKVLKEDSRETSAQSETSGRFPETFTISHTLEEHQ